MLQLFDEHRLLLRPPLGRGDAGGQRCRGQAGVAVDEIERQCRGRHQADHQQERPARGGRGRRFHLLRLGQHPPLHLQHRLRALALGKPSLGGVAVEFGKLRAVQRQRRLPPATGTRAAAERDRERRQRHRRQRQQSNPDHASIFTAR